MTLTGTLKGKRWERLLFGDEDRLRESVQDTLNEGTILCNENDGIIDDVERSGR